MNLNLKQEKLINELLANLQDIKHSFFNKEQIWEYVCKEADCYVVNLVKYIKYDDEFAGFNHQSIIKAMDTREKDYKELISVLSDLRNLIEAYISSLRFQIQNVKDLKHMFWVMHKHNSNFRGCCILLKHGLNKPVDEIVALLEANLISRKLRKSTHTNTKKALMAFQNRINKLCKAHSSKPITLTKFKQAAKLYPRYMPRGYVLAISRILELFDESAIIKCENDFLMNFAKYF
ncbi:hypothetical protein [Campylobacter sputorum]|uniref:hypothetical protein n=1 Tax=Campylobacter sputorum TaxID=206 RepID=UPI000B76D036|nr:hypothetical protein [Campylobacter sputorum]ASM37011.1 hypothetical protein CSF_1147 [Campylobacter sputorum bv. faecalis CCUG 20703]